MQLIEAAKQAGADAVKLQLFDPEWLAKSRADNPAVLAAANGRDLLELYRETVTPREWFRKLKRLADDIGIELFSSVFDPRDIPFLTDLGVKRLKIASFEATNTGLVSACCLTRLPLIVSTSLAHSWTTVPLLVSYFLGLGVADRLTLLHATSYTPGRSIEDLTRVKEYAEVLGGRIPLGLSDHTGGVSNPGFFVRATKNQLKMIEAHLALPEVVTPDSDFSLSPKQFKFMVRDVRNSVG